MNKKISTYQTGGLMDDPGKKKKSVENPLDAELRGSYNKTLPFSGNRSLKDLTLSAAKQANVDPALLLSSAWQEGFNQVVAAPDRVSDAYINAEQGFLEFSDKKSGVTRPRTKQKKLDTAQYPVDAFFGYGIDQLEANYGRLKKFLPAGFESRFQTYDAYNDATKPDPNDPTGKRKIPNPQKVRTAAFKTTEDALIAKGAFLNLEKENVLSLAKKKGVTLDPQALDYFTLASYNQGFGGIQDLFDQYTSAPDRATFLKEKLSSTTSNVAPRINRLPEVRKSLGLEYGGKIPKKPKGVPKYQDGTTLDPITGQPVRSGLENAQNVGQNVWTNAQQTKVPINPNAPQNQQIFRVDNRGDVVQQTAPIIPLSQFYDQSIDRFGNTQFSGTGQYVNEQGQINTQADQQTQFNQASEENRLVAEDRSRTKDKIEFAASTGISAINAFFNKKEQAQQERTNLRRGVMQEVSASVFNPYLEGTGSQAIMEKGGKIYIKPENRGKFTTAAKKADMGVQAYASKILGNKEDYSPALVKRANFAKNASKWNKGEDGLNMGVERNGEMNVINGGNVEPISGSESPMFEFKGNSHQEGGIGIEFGGKVAEVEKDEVGWVGDDGGLNIFGKMKVPGTNKTFKKAAKDMAKAELETDKKKAYYSIILGESDKANKYTESARSTAKVMMDSLNKQSMELEQNKQALADYQNLVLELSGKGENIMAYGGKLPKKSMAYGANGLSIDPIDIDKLVQAIGKKESGGDYKIRGREIKSGPYKGERALGKYQVMPGNLPQWSQEAFGRVISEKEFLDTPELQDQLIRSRVTNLAKQYDNPEDIASIWFSGRPVKGNISSDGNNTVPEYVRDVMKNYGGNEPQGGFKLGLTTFSPKDAKSLYDFVNYDDEHPLNPKNQSSQEDKDNYKRLQGYLGLGGPGDEFKQFKGTDGKQFTSPKGLKPSAFYKDPEVARALLKDQTFPKAGADSNWGPEHDAYWKSLPKEKQDQLIAASSSAQVTSTPNGSVSTDFTPKYNQIEKIDPTKDTKYGAANRDPTEFKDKVNIGTGDRTRGFISPLAIEQIAPELLTMATNKRQAVPQLSYQPELKQTFDLSYQLGRNENQSSFNQVAKIAESTGNVGALSDLAANLYKANEQYNMQEVQGNAAQRLAVYGQNVDTLNDAKLKNIGFIDQQQTKQAAAEYNTWKTDMAGFESIAGKVLQNRLENKTYNAYANLFKHYGFDKKGNVTFNADDVVTRFNAGEAQQFGMMAAQKGIADVMTKGTKTATTYDGDGNVKKVTTVDADLDEFNSIWNSKNLDESQKRKVLSNRKNSIYGDLQTQ